MDARQKQLEDNWKYSEVLKDKDRQIETLQGELSNAIKQVYDNNNREVEISYWYVYLNW